MKENIEATYKAYGYPSPEKLHKILDGQMSISQIEKAIANNKVRQLYLDRPNKIGGHILAYAPKQQYQIDISFMDKFKQQNRGFQYILLVIDVFSRFIWAIPLKTKQTKEVLNAFDTIPKPDCVMSDNGSEFVSKDFQDLLEKRGITQQTAIVGDHHALGIVDRATLTLKNYMYKQFIGNDDVKWYNLLPQIVDMYNNTPHKGIYNYTPKEAFTDKTVQAVLATINTELSENKRFHSDVKIGDMVRTRIADSKFKRGFTPRWSSDVEKVTAIRGNQVYIDGKPYKLIDVQVVNSDEKAGKKYVAAVKNDKVKRQLRQEGVQTIEGLGANRLFGVKVKRKVDGKEYITTVTGFKEPYYILKHPKESPIDTEEVTPYQVERGRI